MVLGSEFEFCHVLFDHLLASAVGIGPVIYLFEGRRAAISRLLQSQVAERGKLSDRLAAFSLFPGELPHLDFLPWLAPVKGSYKKL